MTPFATLKARILKLAPGWVNLAVAKQKAGLSMISTVADAEKVLKVLTNPRKVTPPVPAMVRERYYEAHKLWATRETPEAVRDHGCHTPTMPKIHTANGLQRFIVNYCGFMGCYGNRINTTGRKIRDKHGKEKWITGTTAKGTGDTITCIKSAMVWFEVKINKDNPSTNQEQQQKRIIASGGYYYFVKSAEQFLDLFDSHYYG